MYYPFSDTPQPFARTSSRMAAYSGLLKLQSSTPKTASLCNTFEKLT